MYKYWVVFKKELYLLFNDKVGLSLMFIMPLVLVFIITIIQDSAFKIINENKISLIVVNADKGELGIEFTKLLEKCGMFNVENRTNRNADQLKNEINDGQALTGLYIPNDFTEKIELKSQSISQIIMTNLGLQEKTKTDSVMLPNILFFNDPVIQENYLNSLESLIYSQLYIIENTSMLNAIYQEMGYESVPNELKQNLLSNRVEIIRESSGNKNEVPNSSQHNVPAWTIFAMFFMVISLGANIVSERVSGSFLRLKTMPINFELILFSKQLVYMLVGLIQVFFIFSIGVFIFPLLDLPELIFPSNILGTIVVVLMSCFSAVSYALMVGTLSKTLEQSNGFGAISIIIFAAIGGVWVPTFVMPEYMITISQISPLHWCIEGFYVLFLKDGEWSNLFKPMFVLFLFSGICQTITFAKLKRDKII